MTTLKAPIDSPNPVAATVANEGESKAFIPYPPIGKDLEHVPIHVRADVAYYISRMAFLPNAIKLYLHVPWAAEYLFNVNNAIMRDERNRLSEHFKYRLSLLASRQNVCTYCTAHHAATLKRRWGYTDKQIEEVLSPEGHDEREKVAMEFVRQASADPNAVPNELRARLAKLYSPQEVMEIVLVIGFWKMYNTMHSIMDLPIEDPAMAFKCWIDFPTDK
jgi:AhpD family alkylhydroperoxidase